MHAPRFISLFSFSTILLLGLGTSVRADSISKVDYKASKTSIAAQYKSDKMACDGQGGNAKDICKETAKSRNKLALAELEANYEPSAKHTYEVGVAKADGAFGVAKEKCDDLEGNTKDVCRTEATTNHKAALADAKAQYHE